MAERCGSAMLTVDGVRDAMQDGGLETSRYGKLSDMVIRVGDWYGAVEDTMTIVD